MGENSFNHEMDEIFHNIETLNKVFKNLWWIWNPKARQIPKIINEQLWEKVNHNPVEFFKEVSCKTLIEKLRVYPLNEIVKDIEKEYYEYLNCDNTFIDNNYKEYKNKLIAYFSAEYGFHESFPIYSGGLGVLSGDHCAAASELGLNFVAVGLLYKEGYFQQRINPQGEQEAIYPTYNFKDFPLTLVRDEDGDPIYVAVEFPGRTVYAQIWELKVGRNKNYYLDTDIEKNNETDRKITYQLYGGDRETRISQELILGVGGVRALRKLKLNPEVWHLNEGHSAFLILERIREIMNENKIGFNEAIDIVKRNIVFTTHTPVKAGNEAFSFSLIEKYFKEYISEVNIDWEKFLSLGVFTNIEDTEEFSMTIFALKGSAKSNAVSKLHQYVSQKMWQKVWTGKSVEEVPIDYITNGVNVKSWLAPELINLIEDKISNEWQKNIDNKEFWGKIKEIENSELWDTHKILKKRFINFVRERAIKLYKRNGVSTKIIDEITNKINEEYLTIGFARRFATYKRATLLFTDEDKVRDIFFNTDMPFQIIFAGKAHPADTAGQALIKKIYNYSLQPEFRGKIIFLENYDINMARYMVQGSDVWLNNPRRPYEASGTSGQKAAVNGVINFSVLDGWWAEAYNGKNGWAIGKPQEYEDVTLQDKEDSESLYNVLLNEIIPTYYNRNEKNFSDKWVEIMKESIATILPYFNTTRMVKEYFEKLYKPLI